MPDSGVWDNWLAFDPRIEIVPSVEESCFDKVVRNIFQHVLIMNLLKNDNNDVSSINLANMIELRPVISSVAHLVELM